VSPSFARLIHFSALNVVEIVKVGFDLSDPQLVGARGCSILPSAAGCKGSPVPHYQ